MDRAVEIRRIVSAQNPQYRRAAGLLESRKARVESGCFLQEGLRAIRSLRAASERFELLELWVEESILDRPEPAALCAECGVPVLAVPEKLFKGLADTVHPQGLAAVVRYRPTPVALREDAGLYLLCENIGDPGNLGTLIRSAVAAGIDGVFLHGSCTELLNPKTLRAAMGLLPFIPVMETPPDFFDRLDAAGYRLAATVPTGGEPLYRVKFPRKCVLAVGSEAHGLSPELIGRAGLKITIPMHPVCESLNAAMAGTLCLFQMRHG